MRRAGGPHTGEIAVERAPLVDGRVGRLERLFQGLGDILVAELEEGVANGVGGDLARQLPDRVPAHAVGHHQEVPVLAPDFRVGADADRERILIIAAAKANIADGGIADRLIPAHPVHLIRGRFGK